MLIAGRQEADQEKCNFQQLELNARFIPIRMLRMNSLSSRFADKLAHFESENNPLFS